MVTGRSTIQLTLRAVTIEQEDCVNIDKTFHVTEVCRTAGRQLNAQRRQYRLLNSRMKMFNAFIRASLNCSPLVWVNINSTDLSEQENVQERALRLVYNDKDCSHYNLLLMANVSFVMVKWQRILAAEICKRSTGYISSLNIFGEKYVLYNLRTSKIII